MDWFNNLARGFTDTITFGGVTAAEKAIDEATKASESAYNNFVGPLKAKKAAAATPAYTGGPGYEDLQKQINSLLSAINQKVYAPRLDIAGINAQARSAAENAVNPYYVKTLNDFLAGQAAKRQQQQQQYDINVKGIGDELKQAFEGSQIQRGRTTEDTQEKIGQINTTADEFQTDSGTEFDQERQAQAKLLAAAGLTTSGLGRRQVNQGQEKRNTAEARQERAFDIDRKTAQLFKDRTFEDLVRSDDISNLKSERQKEQVKFDLDSFITNQGFETEQKKSELESQRLQAISSEQGNQGRLLVNSFINSIQSPAQRQAALEAYGGLF